MSMKSRKKANERFQNHRREVIGLIWIAVAVFIALALFSYSAKDPSFTTFAMTRKIHNLGGVVGAYLAGLVFFLLGFGSYFFPLALLVTAVSYFVEKESPGNQLVEAPLWQKMAASLALVFFLTLGSHLWVGEVTLGGQPSDAGGLVGWWLGGRLVRFFGNRGSDILVGAGILLSFVLITRVSLKSLAGKLQILSLFLFQKIKTHLTTFLVVAWARGSKQFLQWIHHLRIRATRGPAIRKPPPLIITQPPRVVTPKPAVTPMISTAPPPSVSVEKKIHQVEGGEPRILPRADFKEGVKKEQLELIPRHDTNYQLPQLSFLDSESQDAGRVDEENLKLNSKLLERKLLDYGVEGRITEIHPGPIITMYEFEPAAGVKVNKIVNLEDDLALTMGGKSVRIIAPLPGKAAVGIEIPNNTRETVWLKDVVGHTKFQKHDSKLVLALGKDTEGIPFVSDLAKMPHLLVAGATGSGKSVQVNSMILSLLYKATPDEVRLILVDLKMLELSIYEGIPHLLLPVVTNPRKASLALRWAVSEMERRYEILAQKATRNISGYNKLVPKEERLPYIVVMIDELADLMMTAAKDVEVSITRLAQMARAAGIHLILATQRPSVDVITGLIKANFPARISFKVSSKHDSRTIIDTVGSEHLLGSGDMLFMSGVTSHLLRVHGAYVSETEILRVVEHWKKQGEPRYLDESILKPMEDEDEKKASGGGDVDDLSDDLYDQAVTLVAETRQASISMIQRRLRIGYNRAARMIERMEKEGVVGPADGAKPREVYAAGYSGGEN